MIWLKRLALIGLIMLLYVAHLPASGFCQGGECTPNSGVQEEAGGGSASFSIPIIGGVGAMITLQPAVTRETTFFCECTDADRNLCADPAVFEPIFTTTLTAQEEGVPSSIAETVTTSVPITPTTINVANPNEPDFERPYSRQFKTAIFESGSRIEIEPSFAGISEASVTDERANVDASVSCSGCQFASEPSCPFTNRAPFQLSSEVASITLDQSGSSASRTFTVEVIDPLGEIGRDFAPSDVDIDITSSDLNLLNVSEVRRSFSGNRIRLTVLVSLACSLGQPGCQADDLTGQRVSVDATVEERSAPGTTDQDCMRQGIAIIPIEVPDSDFGPPEDESPTGGAPSLSLRGLPEVNAGEIFYPFSMRDPDLPNDNDDDFGADDEVVEIRVTDREGVALTSPSFLNVGRLQEADADGSFEWEQLILPAEGASDGKFTVEAADRIGLSDDLTVFFDIDALIEAPTVDIDRETGQTRFRAGESLQLSATVQDPDDGFNLCRVRSAFRGGQLRQFSGTFATTSTPRFFTYTIPDSASGQFSDELTLICNEGDPDEARDTLQLDFNIIPDNRPPTVSLETPVAETKLPSGSSAPLTVSVFDPDADDTVQCDVSNANVLVGSLRGETSFTVPGGRRISRQLTFEALVSGSGQRAAITVEGTDPGDDALELDIERQRARAHSRQHNSNEE